MKIEGGEFEDGPDDCGLTENSKRRLLLIKQQTEQPEGRSRGRRGPRHGFKATSFAPFCLIKETTNNRPKPK
jgi:hypothetical protein